MLQQPARDTLYLIREVHNFGGFFGGDTVTLATASRAAPDDEQTLTIDQQALANVADRYMLAEGMLLALELTGERVDRAELIGAASHTALRAALGPAALPAQLDAPLVLSYRCAVCELWITGVPHDGACSICNQVI